MGFVANSKQVGKGRPANFKEPPKNISIPVTDGLLKKLEPVAKEHSDLSWKGLVIAALGLV